MPVILGIALGEALGAVALAYTIGSVVIGIAPVYAGTVLGRAL